MSLNKLLSDDEKREMQHLEKIRQSEVSAKLKAIDEQSQEKEKDKE